MDRCVHSNDGCVDDDFAQLLLQAETELAVVGATINAGNCYPRAAYETMRRIERYVGLPQLDVGLWEKEMPNPFPEAWREATTTYAEIDLLRDQRGSDVEPWEATALLEHLLDSADEQVAVVTTGPLSEVCAALVSHPPLAEHIRSLVMMAGALRVPGNVKIQGCDGSAEWNVYADPEALQGVLDADTDIPIQMVGLNVTNQLPVDNQFMARLSALGATSRTAAVIAALWKLTAGSHHYLWDPAAAMALINPDLFDWETAHITVDTNAGPSQGRLIECGAEAGGREIQLATNVDREGLLDELFALLA